MDPTIEYLLGKEPEQLDDWFILQCPSSAKFITTSSDNSDESVYGLQESHEKVLDLRDKFKTLSYKNARLLGNPFENLTHPFIDRAGLKLANLDYICSLITEDITRFADVAGAPGAFTEYILWRQESRGIAVKGFGISLKTAKKELDWKVENTSLLDISMDVTSDTIRYRTPLSEFLVTFGADGKGDILKKNNVKAFATVSTKDEKLDLVIADAAMDVSGEEELQEEKNRHLMLAQTIIALETLKHKDISKKKVKRKKGGKDGEEDEKSKKYSSSPDTSPHGGTFVLKIFDAYSRYMVDVINLIACHFTELKIIKPITSRTANSERYLVATGYRGLNIDVSILWKAIKNDVKSFLSFPHPTILDYIVRINDFTAQTQANALEWIYTVDDWLIAGYESVAYPVSYDLTRANKLWDIGYTDIRPGKIVSYLDVSLEIKRFALIASVVEKLTNLIEGEVRKIFSDWLQYSSANGNPPERFTLDLAERYFGKKKDIYEAIKTSYEEAELDDDVVVTKFSTDSSVVITAHTVDGGFYRTYKVPSSVFSVLDRKQGHFYNNQVYLRRAFCIFKRYELLCTFDSCWNWKADYFVQSPDEKTRKEKNRVPFFQRRENKVDFELYATKIVSSADDFFSPCHDLEEETGSLGYPLDDIPPPPFSFNNKQLGLNLLLTTSDKLRKELIRRALSILEEGSSIRLYVLASSQEEKLLESPYYTSITPVTRIYNVQKGEFVRKDGFILSLVKPEEVSAEAE